MPMTTSMRAALVATLCLESACATSTLTIYGVDGKWPVSTGGHESREWLDGVPYETLVVEAQLATPPRALCTVTRHEPAARVTRDRYALDGIGRFLYGFAGATELGIAAALAFIPRAEGDACIGCDVGAIFFGLDGLTSLALAFLIPDTHYRDVSIEAPHEVLAQRCPADVAFEAAGRAFAVEPDGSLLPEHAHALMSAAVETGSAIGLRHGDALLTPLHVGHTR